MATKTTTKTGTKAPQAVKKVEVEVKETPVAEVKKAPVAEVKPAAVRKYEAEDLIPVRSITQGELLMPGKKSGILYRWSAFGDVTEVEYQDLYSLKMSRSAYVYNPMFVIEDEGVLADPKWKDIAELYAKMYGDEDLGAILALPVRDFEATLQNMPKGLLDAVKYEVATRMEDGTFDSIQKIKAVDRVCGTDFMCLVS